jgi:hypothetical protein
MKINNTIIKHYLKNVLFINGTAYAGKSTMAAMLAEKYGLIHCVENYHNKVVSKIATPDQYPNLCYFQTMKDWQEFVNRTPEEYARWVDGVTSEVVQRVPELFHAYIGIGQVAQQLESERLAYLFMLNEFRATNNKNTVRKLERFPIDKGGEVSNKYLNVRSKGMMKLGIGVMHHSTSIMDCVMTVLRYKGYTWKEKSSFPKGNLFSLNCLWDFVLHGKYDYQVAYTIAKEFVRAVEAPIKGFYTFENSAHSPCFEEPERMCHILCTDVLQGKSVLSDKLDS